MAPKSQDDSQDDLSARRRERQAQDTGGTTPSSPRSDASPGKQIDFGAFVSNSVRSSADRLKGGGSSTPPSSTSPKTPRSKPPPSDSSSSRKDRPTRYWRDSFREKTGEDVTITGTSSRRFLNQGGTRQGAGAPVGDREAGQDGNDGGGAGWRTFLNAGDGDGPNRLLWFFLLGILLMALIIFLAIRFAGGNDDEPDDDQGTPVPTMIIDQDGASTPPTETDAGSGDQQQDGAGPTETPRIPRGGDNQRGAPGEEEVEGTPAAVSPFADECADRCLVRVQADNTTEVLEETGIRPSFLGGDVAWVIATPDQISLLDEAADLSMVRDNPKTLSLYVLEVPSGGDESLIGEYGEVLDSAAAYRLVEFGELPARVSTLADNSYSVTKVEPAPPENPVESGDKPALADIQLGLLMGEVSPDNVYRTIQDLSSIGATDDSGLGTRYYTLPGNQMAADYLFQELESYGLNVWYEDFLTPEGLLLVNVVAEAPGADTSTAYAVLSHFDSANDDDPRYAPGADDNASGMAVNLEIARVLGGYSLENPVRFTFVNAEEVGILGATAWAREANATNANIEGVFNVDSVGSGRQGPLIVLNSDAASDWMQDVLVQVNDNYGLGQEILRRQNPIIVADDNMVRAEGIDAVMIAREVYGWTEIHHSTDDVIGNVSMDNVLSMTYLVMLSVGTLAQ